jgi:membrane protease YdiL (CAAX protease family)
MKLKRFIAIPDNTTIQFYAIAFIIPWIAWTIMLFNGFNYYLFYTGFFCSIGGLWATYADGGISAIKKVFRCLLMKPTFKIALITLMLPLTWQLLTIFIFAWLIQPEALNSFDISGFGALFGMHTLWLLTTGPLAEEFGWRGFLLPKLLQTNSFIRTNVKLGFIWALWHLPIMYPTWVNNPINIFYFFTGVTCFSFWLAYTYLSGKSSLLPCILLHWFINAMQEFSFIKRLFPKIDISNPNYQMINLGLAVILTFLINYMQGRKIER